MAVDDDDEVSAGAEASFSDLGPAGTLAAGGDLVVVVDRHAISLFTTR